MRGLATLMPTLITLFLIAWVWRQLYDLLGKHLVTAVRYGIKWVAIRFSDQPHGYVDRLIDRFFRDHPLLEELTGVLLAIVIIYIVGLVVGNLIGRTVYRLGEIAVMRIPLIRAIYPAVKQVTDFVLTDHSHQFAGSRVVACQPHEKGIWSIGLVTGHGVQSLNESVGQEMLTVFVPSSPTAFSGYVLVVPRESVVELPLKVEEAMRLLVSGGVISPESRKIIEEIPVIDPPPRVSQDQPA